MKRTIRQFHRRVNYTSTPSNRLKCEHSLAHSLRIAPPTGVKKTPQLEWDHQLETNNLIWINGQFSRLNDCSEDARLELLYQIAPQPKIHNQSHLQEQQRQYRLKMKKAIASERDNGNVQAAEFLQQILTAKGHVAYSKIEQLAGLPMQRKNQRINMLKTYLNAHNQLQSRPCANSVFLQEGILKIPHQWNVDSKLVSLQEYMCFAELFLKTHFPEYPILAIIGHDDERATDQQTGQHPHYFLSGKNQETGDYDLHKRQIQVVNNYIKRAYPETETLPENGKLTRKQSKVFGEYFQKMLRDYANEHFFHPKALHVEFSPEAEQRSEKRQEMNREIKLPKAERRYNFYTYQLELMQKKIVNAKKTHIELVDATEISRQQLRQLSDNVQQKQTELNTLSEEQKQLNIEVAELKQEKSQFLILKQALTEDVGKRLVNIFRQVIVALHARDKGLQQQMKQYLMKTSESALKLPPALSHMIMEELATIENKPESPSIDKD